MKKLTLVIELTRYNYNGIYVREETEQFDSLIVARHMARDAFNDDLNVSKVEVIDNTTGEVLYHKDDRNPLC